MEIVWGEPKRLANIDKHGLDFADLTLTFFESAVVIAAKRTRFQAIGRLADGTITVIFARLGTEGLSVISMRPAKTTERRLLP
ncbi:BrnT family toxin [Ciceribacter sp. L1K23]|uniref:BrnT family toxin n=1 Tax=Ciceribacter sp. L1K23 TaxID=2820276 RepID=UPI001B827213|nr:BrnT family toxin [Ciceribacter sp. L1K23]MBR0556406.1 BrnT family toxin [Ciceribacter sp. L1K23]